MKCSVSIKGIVWEDEKVWLRKNERNQWEIPGGKIDPGEQPIDTVIREIREELGLKATVQKIVDTGVLSINTNSGIQQVLIVSYLLKIQEKIGSFEFIGEAGNADFQRFSIVDLDSIDISELYKKMIKKSIQT